MKFGVRTPSLKKKISSKTSVKRFVSHNLGVKAPKGMGILRDPEKALYNKVYNKTTIKATDLFDISMTNGGSKKSYTDDYSSSEYYQDTVVDLSLFDETDILTLVSVEFTENGKRYDYLDTDDLFVVEGDKVLVEARGKVKIATVIEVETIEVADLNPRIKYKSIIGEADDDYMADDSDSNPFVTVAEPHQVPEDLKWHEKLWAISLVAFLLGPLGSFVSFILLFRSRRLPTQGKIMYGIVLLFISAIGSAVLY